MKRMYTKKEIFKLLDDMTKYMKDKLNELDKESPKIYLRTMERDIIC